MRAETHPWLKWPGCNQQKKIELNNQLALLQNKNLAQPRFVQWSYMVRLGINEDLEEMFMTSYEGSRGRLDIPIWRRALEIEEDSYRELCLEFYSSLKLEKRDMEKDIMTTPMISFRLGGQEHNVTVARFGELTGLLENHEVEQTSLMRGYLVNGEWDKARVKENANRVWERLSGIEEFKNDPKVKDIRSPILRVVHKLIAYSFHHRSSQHDKVYVEDLWILHTLNRRNPNRYINAPWALACYMKEKGRGRQHDSPMLCGNYITKIAKTLGLATHPSMRFCSPPVEWRELVQRDFRSSGLLQPGGSLIEEEEPAPRSPPPQRQGRRRQTMMEAIENLSERFTTFGENMGRQVARIDRNVVGMGNYMGYMVDRYQPSWEAAAIRHHASSSSTTPWPEFAPPMMFPPSPPRDEPEEEDEPEDEEEEEGDEEEEVEQEESDDNDY